MSSESTVAGNFEQPLLPVADPVGYGAVHTAIEHAFSSGNVSEFLRSLERNGIRIRQFEELLGKGLLGQLTMAQYNTLENADQGQIREFYLSSLEKVPVELRSRFFKLYAYY